MFYRWQLAAGLILCALPSPPLRADSLSVSHRGVGCIVAETFPRFGARSQPEGTAARGIVRFRPGGGKHWYSVAMSMEGGELAAILPKPMKKLKRIDYYIEVTGTDFSTARTRDYSPAVVTGLGACKDGIAALTVPAAIVLVEAPAGAPQLPAGFSAEGVVSTASATAAAGHGAITALAIGGGVAAAAGAAAAVGAGSGGDGSAGAAAPCNEPPNFDFSVSTVCSGTASSHDCFAPEISGVDVAVLRNNSCHMISLISLQYAQGGTCGPGAAPRDITFRLASLSVRPYSEATLFSNVDSKSCGMGACCVGRPCGRLPDCTITQVFTLETSHGTKTAVASWVSLNRSCPQCPATSAAAAASASSVCSWPVVQVRDR